MQDAGDELRAAYAGLSLSESGIPVYANATAAPYDSIDLLFRQVSSPVLWYKTVENLCAEGVTVFIEVGAGKTLRGLIGKIAPEATALSVEDADSLKSTLEVLQNAQQ